MAKVYYHFDYLKLIPYQGFEDLFVRTYNKNYQNSYAIVQNFFTDKKTKTRSPQKKQIKIFYHDEETTQEIVLDQTYTTYIQVLKELKKILEASEVKVIDETTD